MDEYVKMFKGRLGYKIMYAQRKSMQQDSTALNSSMDRKSINQLRWSCIDPQLSSVHVILQIWNF